MSRARFVRLSDSDYMHGDAIFFNDRQALVVRAYEGEWTVFFYKDFRLWCTWFQRPDTSKQRAMREALQYLKTGTVVQRTVRQPKLMEKEDELLKRYFDYAPYKSLSLDDVDRVVKDAGVN